MTKDIENLLAEVEALCATFTYDDPWGRTLKRIDRLKRLVKKIRKASK